MKAKKEAASKKYKSAFNLVFIKWIDSCAATASWTMLKDLNTSVCLECHTVGFLLHEDEHKIIISASLGLNNAGDSEESFDLGIIIPKSAILSIKKLQI